jgi:phosphoglycerate dehydrogenase-like enzyme
LHRVLVASRSFGRGASRKELEELLRQHGLNPVFSSIDQAGESIGECEGIIIGTEQAGAALFDRSKVLKAIIKYGVGTDNIDARAAEQRGIKVLSLPEINSAAVAEMALGLMLACARKIVEGDRALRNRKADRPVGVPVRGKTLGLLGTGAIGMALVQMVSGLEMSVLAYDIKPNPELVDLGGRYLPRKKLLEDSDFLSIHLPLNDRTFHSIGAQELSSMKPGAILINTSRGGVVDEEALYAALVKKKIGGAALDVFETKLPWKSKILSLKNVVCTPHIAAYTDETLRSMDAACVSTLSRALEEQRQGPEGGSARMGTEG